MQVVAEARSSGRPADRGVGVPNKHRRLRMVPDTVYHRFEAVLAEQTCPNGHWSRSSVGPRKTQKTMQAKKNAAGDCARAQHGAIAARSARTREQLPMRRRVRAPSNTAGAFWGRKRLLPGGPAKNRIALWGLPDDVDRPLLSCVDLPACTQRRDCCGRPAMQRGELARHLRRE